MKLLNEKQLSEVLTKTRRNGKMQTRISIVRDILETAQAEKAKAVCIEASDFQETSLHYNVFAVMKNEFENHIDIEKCSIGNSVDKKAHTYDSFTLTLK
jgi:hypothetical protein